MGNILNQRNRDRNYASAIYSACTVFETRTAKGLRASDKIMKISQVNFVENLVF